MDGRTSQIALQDLNRVPSAPSDSDVPSYDDSDHHNRQHPHADPPIRLDADELPAYSRAAPRDQNQVLGCYSTHLHRSIIVPFFTTIFVALIIYSWAMLCILSYRPVSTRSWEPNTDRYGYYPKKPHPNYKLDADIYRSAKIIQSIISVLILPWTSAVCAYAAVIFVQNQKNGLSMTMRQVMNLADRRWLDPSLIADIFSGHWKKNGSLLLGIALFLHFLGLIIYPIQSIVMNSTTRHTPTWPIKKGEIADLGAMRSPYDAIPGQDVIQARKDFSTVDPSTWQSTLWSRDKNQGNEQLSTFTNQSEMIDPFYSPLPNGFNTGVLRQYAPRINSNTSVRIITEKEYPTNCSDPSNLYARYESIYEYRPGSEYASTSTFVLSACMLSSNTSSPWIKTRDRQDFDEFLYVNASFAGMLDRSSSLSSSSPLKDGNTLLEIKVHTTAGYFELPNYGNNQTAGPLLDLDPLIDCARGGYGCIPQQSSYYLLRDLNTRSEGRVRRQSETETETETETSHTDSDSPSSNTDNSTLTTNQTMPWIPLLTPQKGPLLTTALAIFGPGSFMNKFFADYNAIQSSMFTADVDTSIPKIREMDYSDRKFCLETAPLAYMLSSRASSSTFYSPDTCISMLLSDAESIDAYGEYEMRTAQRMAVSWIEGLFLADVSTTINAFDVAAFLSNKRFFENLDRDVIEIYVDLGHGISVPSSSLAGIIVVSILLGIYVLGLLGLVFYGSRWPRWTSLLDSFVMLRFGAACGNAVFPLMVGIGVGDVKELDEVSGVVRDVGGVEGGARADGGSAGEGVIPVGRVGLGEGKPLTRKRYECYQGDNEPLTIEEIRKIRRGG